MCTRPLTISGIEVSCGECNECIATYKNTWIARCIAEKATSGYAYAFTLTYSDVNGEAPLGAKVFRYKDIQEFWKRVRNQTERKFKEKCDLSYVIVGEKGTRKGRVHYHGVMFTSHPIKEIGKFKGAKSEGFAFNRRLDWTTWGQGFVEFQQADRKGMAYILKYILKSRMTAARSAGYAREGKTEWLASSYLWCSKKPPIGSRWLWEKLHDLRSKGMCPPSLRMRTPGGGDWYIGGELQTQVCLWLHDANKQFRSERGHDLAGFNPLCDSLKDEILNEDTGELWHRKPWELLKYGEQAGKRRTHGRCGRVRSGIHVTAGTAAANLGRKTRSQALRQYPAVHGVPQ